MPGEDLGGFPTLRALLGGLVFSKKEYGILGSVSGSPYLRKLHVHMFFAHGRHFSQTSRPLKAGGDHMIVHPKP